jgi:hypothetical protein
MTPKFRTTPKEPPYEWPNVETSIDGGISWVRGVPVMFEEEFKKYMSERVTKEQGEE